MPALLQAIQTGGARLMKRWCHTIAHGGILDLADGDEVAAAFEAGVPVFAAVQFIVLR